MIYRQGDILLRRVDEIPLSDKCKVDATDGKHVIAEGEVTGHVHAVAEREADTVTELYFRDVPIWQRNRRNTTANEVEMYLKVTGGPVPLTHDEHSTLTIPEGNYQIIRQREYDVRKVRRVAD